MMGRYLGNEEQIGDTHELIRESAFVPSCDVFQLRPKVVYTPSGQ